MMRCPQRTEAAQRLEARTARTFAAPLRAGVSSNKCPARSQAEAASAGVRARGVPLPLSLQPQHSESATQRHGACGVAMHAACASRRCRRTAAARPGRARASSARRCSVSLAAARGCGQHLRLAASAGLSLWQRLSSHCIGRRCSPALCKGMQRLSCGIGGARTPRAAAMFVRRAMAAHGRGTHRARASAQGGFRWLRAGPLVELTPQPPQKGEP